MTSLTPLIALTEPTIVHGTQSVYLTQLLRHPRQPHLSYQVDIRCDSYGFQSHAHVRPVGQQVPLVSIPYADMDALKRHAYWGASASEMQRGVPLDGHLREALLSDRDRLVALAERALGLDVPAVPDGPAALDGATRTALKLLIDSIDRGEVDRTALTVLRSAVA